MAINYGNIDHSEPPKKRQKSLTDHGQADDERTTYLP